MTSPKKHIIFIHLLNDFSGSPGILAQTINAVPSNLFEKTLIVSNSSHIGFLSDLENVETLLYWYRWKSSDWLRLITYGISQFHLFIILLKFMRKDVIIHINTLLPFGAGLAAAIMQKKVIYHIHETTIKPKPLKYFLKWVANISSNCNVYVSTYLMSVMKLKSSNIVINNSLSDSFINTANKYKSNSNNKNVLMICSLKQYKGVNEFILIATELDSYSFELVLNADKSEVENFTKSQAIPKNVTIYHAQKDVHSFYQEASIVLNLSHPETWVETFGMTILEAMSYGIPVIAPNIGGPTEIINNGLNGYLISIHELEKIKQTIRNLKTDNILYNKISIAAKLRSTEFSNQIFSMNILNTINGL